MALDCDSAAMSAKLDKNTIPQKTQSGWANMEVQFSWLREWLDRGRRHLVPGSCQVRTATISAYSPKLRPSLRSNESCAKHAAKHQIL